MNFERLRLIAAFDFSCRFVSCRGQHRLVESRPTLGRFRNRLPEVRPRGRDLCGIPDLYYRQLKAFAAGTVEKLVRFVVVEELFCFGIPAQRSVQLTREIGQVTDCDRTMPDFDGGIG